MSDLYAEGVEAEPGLIEVASLAVAVSGPWAQTYVVVDRDLIQDVAGEALTCGLGVRRVHVRLLGVCTESVFTQFFF